MAESPPRPRRWPIALSLALAAVVAAHTAIWLIATKRIEDGIPPFLANAAAAGWHFEAGAPARAGWPWAASVRIPSVLAIRTAGSLRWRADSIRLTLSALHPGILDIAPEGAQSVQVGDRTVPLRADQAELQLPLDGNGPGLLLVRNLVVGTESQRLALSRLSGAITPLAMTLQATDVTLIPPMPPPFAAPADLTFRALSTQPVPQAETQATSANAWRAAGGTISIADLTLLWGPLTANGSGTIQLDAALQPEGQATIRILGASEALEAAAKSGLIRRNPAAAARAVLGLLTLGANGGPVILPVTLKDQTLTVAQFPVLRVPTLSWDAP